MQSVDNVVEYYTIVLLNTNRGPRILGIDTFLRVVGSQWYFLQFGYFVRD